MSVQDLRDVLRERAEHPSPANPRRHDQVRARIRRTRLRRGAAGFAVAAAAVVVGVSLLPGSPLPVGPLPGPSQRDAAGPASRETATTTVWAGRLPESFTTPDGTEYRRVATAGLAATGAKDTTVKVPYTGRPLEAAVGCDGNLRADLPSVLVNGRRATAVGGGCDNGISLQPLDVTPGSTEVAVTFGESDVTCVRLAEDGPCEPAPARQRDWELAVYEWTPPAEEIVPEPLLALPRQVDGKELADSESGMWPRESSSFTLTGRSDKGVVSLDQICSGDLAPRLWFKFWVDGKESPSTSCPTWREGPFPTWSQEFRVPPGEVFEVEVQMGMWGESANRPVRWSLGLYVK